MDSPSLSAASSFSSSSKRSPFVPVRRHREREQPQQQHDDDRDKHGSSVHTTPTASTLRPPVVPLTTSNLCRYTAALSNERGGPCSPGPGQGDEKEQHAQQTVKSAVKMGHSDSVFRQPALSAYSREEPSQNNNVNNISQIQAKSLGHGLPSTSRASNRPTEPPKLASTTSLLSAKRYTRQMAAPRDDEQDNSHEDRPNGMLAASDLRARARLTSGSAPRRKAGVPGAERADRPPSSLYSRPETPSSSSSIISRARARSITASTTTAASASSRPASIARTPSRPPSRAGVFDGFAHPQSISRPQSRMDDFPPDAIISATSIHGPEDEAKKRTNARRGSDSSVGTVVQRRQENVLVCVRVRPPAVAHTERHANPAHLEEAWFTSPDDKCIALADGSGHQYRFGKSEWGLLRWSTGNRVLKCKEIHVHRHPRHWIR